MALSVSQTAALAGILKPGMRVASMGYPDLIAVVSDLAGLKYRADSEAICKRHGLPLRQIPDAHSYFELQGCALDVYDIVQERGDEILCDLNLPLKWLKEMKYVDTFYDIVLDVGTLEHCFNVAQAVFNMAALVKVGGHIIHENPFLMGNHGFYGMQPTFYADFYENNGFEIQDLKLVNRHGGEARVPPVNRFKFVEQEVNTFCIAKRVRMQEFVFPTQSKYAKMYAAAGLSGETKGVANG